MPFQFALLNEGEVHQAYNDACACSHEETPAGRSLKSHRRGIQASCLLEKDWNPLLDPLKEVFASPFGLYFLLPIGVDDVQVTVWIALEFVP